jgi:lipopolysaccharide biosynthesis regulator YciM
MTLDLERSAGTATGSDELVTAGMRGAGDYRCTSCGYGIVTFALLPACPMCHGESWRGVPHGPFTMREHGASAEH